MKYMQYQGWLICASATLLQTLLYGVQLSYGEFVIVLHKELHESMTHLGWIYSLSCAFSRVTSPLSTVLYLRYGAYNVVFPGVFLAALGVVLAGMASDVNGLILTFGFVFGMGSMLTFNPSCFLLNEYFPLENPHHVLVTSLIVCSFPAASIIFNPVTVEVMKRYGWRVTLYIYGASILIIGTLTSLTFRPKPDVESSDTESQSEYPEFKDKPGTALRTRIILGSIWMVVSVLKVAAYEIPVVVLVMHMTTMGIPQAVAARGMIFISSVELVSRVVTCLLGDKFKGRFLYIYVLFTFLLALTNIGGAFAYNLPTMLVYGVGVSLFAGPIICAMYTCGSEVLEERYTNELFTIFMFAVGLGAVLGVWVAGVIFDRTGSYTMVFLYCSLTYLISSLLYGSIILLNKYRPLCIYPESDYAHVSPN